MGNHYAGHAIVGPVISLHQKGLLSQDILDAICEPWRGCDAEFDLFGWEDGWPGGGNEKMKIRARNFRAALNFIFDGSSFPNRTNETDEEWDDIEDQWYVNVYRGKFVKRYDFC